MIPMKPAATLVILICSLSPMRADSESTSPEARATETATRDRPNRGGAESGPGLRQTEPATGDGQGPQSAEPSGSNERRGKTPSLGLCDGS
jgi:hypothetical protein